MNKNTPKNTPKTTPIIVIEMVWGLKYEIDVNLMFETPLPRELYSVFGV